MGRGRTTTGMIIAALLHLRKVDAFPIGKKPDLRGENEKGIFFCKALPQSFRAGGGRALRSSASAAA